MLAGDENAASAALNELEAGSGLASASVIKVEEALANIFAAEYGMGTPDSDQNAPADADSAASDSVTEEEAARLITKTDKYRADYYKYYTNGNYWTNPVNYDLTINSEKVGIEDSVKLIKDYMKIKGIIK